MSQRSAFFDAQNGDRSYASADFARLFASLTPRDGVVTGDGDQLAVTPTSPASMAVQVGLGSAWIQGRHYNLFDTPEVLTIAAADPSLPRIDRIVVRMDTAAAARTITVQAKQGTPSASPVPPSLERNSTAWEISLARVWVNAGDTMITAASITDERGDESVCGLVVREDRTSVRNVREFGAVGDGFTDDRMSIQAALYAANSSGGGVVYVPDGTYLITDALIIYSNTRLTLSPSATILRGGNFDNMIRNGDSDVNGYDGESNIIIEGGTWDGNKDVFSSSCTIIALGHGQNLTVRDLTIRNVPDFHHIEVSGCKDVLIQNCRFLDWGGAVVREAVQIDVMSGPGVWLWFGNFDNTPCYNVTVQNCTFERLSEGIGTHNAVAGVTHKIIKILGCHFSDLTGDVISGLNYERLTVQGCSFDNCELGIVMETLDTELTDFNITDNEFYNLARSAASRAIWIRGESGFPLRNGIIKGNTIRTIGRHAIGIENCDGWSVASNEINDVGNDPLFNLGVGLYFLGTTNAIASANVIEDCGVDSLRVESSSSQVVVTSNLVDSIAISNSDEVIVTNNIADTAINQSGAGPAGYRIFNNFVAGTWVP